VCTGQQQTLRSIRTPADGLASALVAGFGVTRVDMEPGYTITSARPEHLEALADMQSACTAMLAAGFKQALSFNPYWELRGRTFEDPDGYRVVLQNTEWDYREGE
jgi:hypothetical protein